MECPWSLLISPKWFFHSPQSMTTGQEPELSVSADWSRMFLVSAYWIKRIPWNLPSLCWLVCFRLESPWYLLIGAISMVSADVWFLFWTLVWMSLLKHKMFDRTHICFNDMLVWLSMNPPSAYLVKYISHNSCLPELLIAAFKYIPSNYGQVYKKTPKLSKVKEQNQCMYSKCGNIQALTFGSFWNQRQHLQELLSCLWKPKTFGCWVKRS